MDDCVIISDDEDVELLDYVVNIEPIVIDLTRVRNQKCDRDKQYHPKKHREPDPNLNSTLDPKSYSNDQQPVPHDDSETNSNPNPNPEPEPVPSENRESDQEGKESDRLGNFSSDSKVQSEPDLENQSKSNPTVQIKSNPQLQENNPPCAHIDSHRNGLSKEDTTLSNQPRPKRTAVDDKKLMLEMKELGNEKYRNNLFTDAIKVYRRADELAVQLNDKDTSAKLHFNLAMTYYKLGSFNQALDEFIEAVKIDDKYHKAYAKRGEIYLRQKRFDEAVICFEHLCEMNGEPTYAMLLHRAREEAKRSKKKDNYQILGLNSVIVTHEALKKAYRQQALSHHPDRHSGADVVTRKIEEKKFKDAFEAIKNLETIMGYDR